MTAGISRSRMRARARLRTELVSSGPGRTSTRLAVLHSEAPLKLRPTIARPSEPYVERTARPGRVCLAASAAGPMGGDDFALDIEVGAGSTLVLREASATLLLPGVDRSCSQTRVRVRVHAGATFVWLPEPIIAARDCRHLGDVVVDLAADARLLMREELLLGRRGEAPGVLQQKIVIRRDHQTLHAQELRIGDGQQTGPAIVGPHRAIGSMIISDPALPALGAMSLGGDGVLLPLATGTAMLAHALAADSIGVRDQLDTALAALGIPEGQTTAGAPTTTIEEAG